MRKWLIITLAVTTLAGLGSAGAVQAADMQTGQSVTIGAEETVEDDLYASGQTVRIEGRVAGDVYVASRHVIVNGHVEGDVLAAANTVTVSGSVGGSIRAAGNSLDLSGANVGGGVTFFGATLSSNQDVQIGHGVTFFGESATLNGSIGNGLSVFSQSVTIGGDIGTDSRVTAENLTITQTAALADNLTLYSDNQPEVANGASITGDIATEPAPEHEAPDLDFLRYPYLLWSLLALLVTGAVLLLLGRKPLNTVSATVRKQPLLSFGIGILGLLVALPLGIILLISVLGIPLALLWWLFVGVGIYLSTIFVGIATGKLLLERTSQRRPRLFASFALGVVLLYLIYLIPILGPLAMVVTVSTGFGALLIETGRAVGRQHR